MRISKERLDAYNAKVRRWQQAAHRNVAAQLAAFAKLNPAATVQEWQDYTVAVLYDAVSAYGDAAAAWACEAYDQTMAELGVNTKPAEPHGYTYDTAKGTVYDAARAIDFSRPDAHQQFTQLLTTKAFDAPRRAANRTMWRNATRDRRHGVGYARVPSGRETCGFCLMLASRGFVYRSEEAAGDIGGRFNRYHDRCDCTVVAGTGGTTVEGYDPDWLYDVYLDSRRTADTQDYNAICREIELRTREWAWNHTPVKVEYRRDPANVPAHARTAADTLAAHGFGVRVRDTDEPTLYMNGAVWGLADSDTETPGRKVILLRPGESIDQASARVMAHLASDETCLVVSADERDEDTGLLKLRRLMGPAASTIR